MSRQLSPALKPKLLYLVTEDWFFCSHFLPMARAAREAGYEVVVATRVREHGAAITGEGFRLLSLATERRSLSPLRAAGALGRMLRLLRRERPDLVHCIALPMVVLGGAAARLCAVPSIILAPTGLGHLWIETGTKSSLARHMTRVAVAMLQGRGVHFLFENGDDPCELGVDPDDRARVTLVGGAGVDAARFAPSVEPPASPVRVAVVARMITPKGIAEAVGAVRLARARGADIELNLFGAPDPHNRRSIPLPQLEAWSREPGVRWHGPTSDVARVWREHHIALLLSCREGAPRSLIEAAASGRPIVASDVTGCREVVIHGGNGFLVPPHDHAAAADALIRLAGDADLRMRFGRRGRTLFEERFTEAAVSATVVQAYRRVRGETVYPTSSEPVPEPRGTAG